MRLRNVTGSREFIAENEYCIHEPEKMKGIWRQEFFHNDHPIHLEIGMGKGIFLHTLAEGNPEINYLGIEKYSSVLYRAIEKRQQVELDNLYFIRFDATELETIFAPGEVDRIYLNFSDPWPKDRHAKRRLTSPQFLELYDLVLADDGYIQFKTDNRGLFDYSVETVEASEKWRIRELTYDLHNSDQLAGNVMTEYESKFVGLGHPICRCVIDRCPE